MQALSQKQSIIIFIFWLFFAYYTFQIFILFLDFDPESLGYGRTIGRFADKAIVIGVCIFLLRNYRVVYYDKDENKFTLIGLFTKEEIPNSPEVKIRESFWSIGSIEFPANRKRTSRMTILNDYGKGFK